MRTLMIEIPDNESGIISKISDILKGVGGNIVVDSDDNLTQSEFDLLQESYKEALLIKQGIKNAIPVSELWND